MIAHLHQLNILYMHGARKRSCPTKQARFAT